MKKLIVWMLVLSLFGCLILTSCGESTDDPKNTTEQTVDAVESGSENATEFAGTEKGTEKGTEQATEPATAEQQSDVVPGGDLYDPNNWTKNY